MISEAWSCLDLLFRHWGSWWFTIVNMYRKDWPGGGKAGGFFTFYHRMWSTYSSVPCKKNGANLPKSPEAQYLYHSLSLPLHLSFYLSLSISVSFKSRLQDSQLNTIERFFVAQKALALTELSPSLSFACLTKMTNAGMRGTLGCEWVTTVGAHRVFYLNLSG